MPTGNDNGIENAYMLDENRNVLGKVGNIETVTLAVTGDESKYFSIPRSFSFTTKYKTKKINRKTFCRELIKLGFTKNEAKDVARVIRRNYGNYLLEIRLFGKEYANKLVGGKNGRTGSFDSN